jgi:hypothetical protein
MVRQHTALARAGRLLLLLGALMAPSVVRASGPTTRAGVESLCGDRPDCSEELLFEFVPGQTKLFRADVKSEHAPESIDCYRREYWALSPEFKRLVAVDSAKQCGADSLGPASVRVKGEVLTLYYLEYLSSDGCMKAETRISLRTMRVLSDRRWEGTFSAQKCVHWRPLVLSHNVPKDRTNGAMIVFHID